MRGESQGEARRGAPEMSARYARMLIRQRGERLLAEVLRAAARGPVYLNESERSDLEGLIDGSDS